MQAEIEAAEDRSRNARHPSATNRKSKIAPEPAAMNILVPTSNACVWQGISFTLSALFNLIHTIFLPLFSLKLLVVVARSFSDLLPAFTGAFTVSKIKLIFSMGSR